MDPAFSIPPLAPSSTHLSSFPADRFDAGRDYTGCVAFSPDGQRLATTSGRSALVWDVSSMLLKSAPTSFATAWADLASTDGVRGFNSIRHFIDHPAEAFKAFAVIKAVPVADAARVAKWIEQLDAPRFADREAASKSLLTDADQTRGALQSALLKSPSAESRQRIEAILAATGDDKPLTGDALRTARAIEVLERIGTTEAQARLKELVGGAADAARTRDAAVAVQRLNRRCP